MLASVQLASAVGVTVTPTIVGSSACNNPTVSGVQQGCMPLSSYATGAAAGRTISTLTFNSGSVTDPNGIATLSGFTVPGQGTAPTGDGTTFLSTSSSTGTISFRLPESYFGLYWGTPDSYNTIAFYSAGTQLASFTGSLLSGDSFVSFNVTGGTFDQVVLSSSNCCFEIDNVSYVTASPEPGSFTLAATMALALPVYFVWRRRKYVLARAAAFRNR